MVINNKVEHTVEKKNMEIIFNFHYPCPDSAGESFKFLGTTVQQKLKRDTNIACMIKKAHQHLYFLYQHNKFKVSQMMAQL